MKRDPAEQTEAYIGIEDELETKIDKELEGVPQGHGYCYEYWAVKKRILREDYGIEWNSPKTLNPHIRFD